MKPLTRLEIQRINALKDLYAKGYSQADAAKTLAINRMTVSRWYRKWGMVPKEENKSFYQSQPLKLMPRPVKPELDPVQRTPLPPPEELTPSAFEDKEKEIRYNAMCLFNNMINELDGRLECLTNEELKETILSIWGKLNNE